MRAINAAVAISWTLWVFTPCQSAETDWPRTWLEGPNTASELGLTTFSQSPALDGLNLPPVKKRLPDDPVVIVPLEQTGRFGGEARITQWDWWTFLNVEPPLTISADLRRILPNLAESWSVSDDGRHITLNLRPGIKWSDGVPLTADDFVFAFNELWLDKEYSPVTDWLVRGGRIVKINDLSFRYEFEEPRPLFVNVLAQYGDWFVVPKHYYSNFHPAYVDREILDERIRKTGFMTWQSFIYACRLESTEESADVPTLRAYRVVRRTPVLVRYERNPYYFKVDPTGQQLPYIDTIVSEVVANTDVVAMKASTGQLDFAGYVLRIQDMPVFKIGEQANQIKVHVWNRLQTSDVVIQPNYNYADERLRSLYWDDRFRRALSHAIDREEMNEIIYFGRATPGQVTAHPTSAFFEPEFARAHTDYDPILARDLLDAIGLFDRDGDGLREYPDGTSLVIIVEYINVATPKEVSMELITEYWRDVGINVRMKQVDFNLQAVRAPAGDMQMTLWHADFATEILFPVFPDWWVPRSTNWSRGMWSSWERWYQSEGRLGEAPPPIIRQLQEWANEMRATTDTTRRVELGKKILATNAEKLWTIGTVGLSPQPIVVSTRLKNVPASASWGWDNRWTLPYHPATWYLSETAR